VRRNHIYQGSTSETVTFHQCCRIADVFFWTIIPNMQTNMLRECHERKWQSESVWIAYRIGSSLAMEIYLIYMPPALIGNSRHQSAIGIEWWWICHEVRHAWSENFMHSVNHDVHHMNHLTEHQRRATMCQTRTLIIPAGSSNTYVIRKACGCACGCDWGMLLFLVWGLTD